MRNSIGQSVVVVHSLAWPDRRKKAVWPRETTLSIPNFTGLWTRTLKLLAVLDGTFCNSKASP